MTIRFIVPVALFAAPFLALGGTAEPVPGVTVADLVTRVLARNGDLLAVRQQVGAARGGLTQAGLRANPSFEVNGMKEAAGTDNNFMLGASLPLELYGRRERRMEVAAGGVKVSESTAADRERTLRAEVEATFGEVLAGMRNLRFTLDLLALNRKSLDLTEARVGQGAAAPLDANLLRVEVSRIDAMRADYEGKVGMGLLELKSLAGMRPGDDLQLTGTLDPEPAIVGDEALALENRPDLVALRANEQLSAARLKQAQTDGRPDASISANYQRMDSGFDVNGFNSAGQSRRVQGIFHDLTVGLTVQLPVRNRNQGSIETATAQMEESHRRREYGELVAAREIAVARLASAKARESLEIYDRGVRGQAAQNLELIRKVYELGRSPLQDVIAEQRRYIEIETGYTEVLSRNYQASVRLRAALGKAGL